MKTVRPKPETLCTSNEDAQEGDGVDVEMGQEAEAGRAGDRADMARRPRPARDPGQPTRRE